MSIFANNLREIMTKNKISIGELSNKTKIDKSTIAKWLSQDTNPRLNQVIAVADELDISIDELTGRSKYQMIMNIENKLTDEQSTLLLMFSKLSTRNKYITIGYVDGLIRNQKE